MRSLRKKPAGKSASLDRLIEEITIHANGDDEQLWAFRQAFEDEVPAPIDATIAGAPVQVLSFGYDGNERCGLTALCLGADGRKHVIAAHDLAVAPGERAARYLAAYRRWMGLAPLSAAARATPRRKPAGASPKAEGPVELVLLSVKQNAVRCRVPGSDDTLTLRPTGLWHVAPGEIAVVQPAKHWTYAGNPYVSGAIESTRLDAKALGLTPLRLEQRGIWNPAEHYWGDEGEPIGEWAKPIIARGPREVFEMEQVLPGADAAEPFSDPITESNDLRYSGDWRGARKILMDLCQADLRCLDAHSHLGNLVFDRSPEDAIRHYEAGFRIGELSLGPDFDGLLPWGWIDNRPFLRCMHGFGLCLWRLGRFAETASIFERMLWLNPTDNQGVRLVLAEVRAGEPWRED